MGSIGYAGVSHMDQNAALKHAALHIFSKLDTRVSVSYMQSRINCENGRKLGST